MSSMQINYTSSALTITFQTSLLKGAPTLANPPFFLEIQPISGGMVQERSFSSSDWAVVSDQGTGLTTYSRTNLPVDSEVQVMDLEDYTDPNYLNFWPSGFLAQGDFRTVPVDDGLAPTLTTDGIVAVGFRADGATALQPNEVAYTISFSEAVSIPQTSAKSTFGGVPATATITVTPVQAGQETPGHSSDWHVLIQTADATEAANVSLVLKPALTVIAMDPGDVQGSPPFEATVKYSDAADLSSLFWTKIVLNGPLYEGLWSGAPDIELIPTESQTGSQWIEGKAIAESDISDNVVYVGTASAVPYAQTGYEVELAYYDAGAGAVSPLGGDITDMFGDRFKLASPESIPSVEAALDALTATVIAPETLDEQTVNGAAGVDVDSTGAKVLDTVDFRDLPSDRLQINAKTGLANINFNGEWYQVDIADYDRYILSDRVGTYGADFEGTADSEYVIVGNGGDNYLDAENQNTFVIPAGATDEEIEGFVTKGLLKAETDIVDYSRATAGVNVDLGDFWKDGQYSAAGWSEVFYSDNRPKDYIRGFEGVVGSTFGDEISGSELGNFIAGGSGDDTLRGYSGSDGFQDGLYNPEMYGDFYYEGTGAERVFREEQYDLDTRDVLVGGEGYDRLYGGAGGDILVDFDGAQMWGSDRLGRSADDRTNAEYDMFVVRGDGEQKATINEFHLSKDGTGLAGRSKTANDSIVFSIDTAKLGEAAALHMDDFVAVNQDATVAEKTAELYKYVYPKLSFEQSLSALDEYGNRDLELKVVFKADSGSSPVLVGSTIVADVGDELMGGLNQTGVVELAWLAETMRNDHNGYNPSIDMDMLGLTGAGGFLSDLNVAIALELQRAGTVRGANQFGVMAADLKDEYLAERYYNPGAADDKIIGTRGNDAYEYKVQDFVSDGETDNSAGDDMIFDIGGGDDTLMFERATVKDLTFSAVRVGRESGKDSLKIDYAQSAFLDEGQVTNAGTVTWQGHFQHGGRQTVEVLELGTPDGSQKFSLARAEYEYDHRGRVISDSKKIVADDTYFAAIMVGDEAGADEFVIDANLGFARIAGFSVDDRLTVTGGQVQSLMLEDTDGDGLLDEAKVGVMSELDSNTSLIRLSLQGYDLGTESAQADLELALGLTSQP